MEPRGGSTSPYKSNNKEVIDEVKTVHLRFGRMCKPVFR